MNYSLFFPTPITQMDPLDDNLDICIGLEDGRSYTFVVATPENLKTQMRKEGLTYLPPGSPILIVERITEDSIRALIESMLDDPAVLEIYGSDHLH